MTGNPQRVDDLLKLQEIWESLGLRVKRMDGWRDRGRGGDNTFEVLGCHHTGDTFDVDRVLRDGRSDLPGPLCNVALHADGDVLIVASGIANHFGCSTWPNKRSLGVEATGPQTTGPKFPNRDAYVALAAGFCIFKGNADPKQAVRSDVGIPVRLVAAHKEVAVGVADSDGNLICNETTRKIYGRKPDPDFEENDSVKDGALDHGFSVKGRVRLIDKFRDDVHARVTRGDDMTDEQARQLNAIFQGLTVQGTTSPEETINELFNRIKRIEAALIVPGTNSAEDAFNLLFKRIREIHHKIVEEP
jgi:hypothetical protein